MRFLKSNNGTSSFWSPLFLIFDQVHKSKNGQILSHHPKVFDVFFLQLPKSGSFISKNANNSHWDEMPNIPSAEWQPAEATNYHNWLAREGQQCRHIWYFSSATSPSQTLSDDLPHRPHPHPCIPPRYRAQSFRTRRLRRILIHRQSCSSG